VKLLGSLGLICLAFYGVVLDEALVIAIAAFGIVSGALVSVVARRQRARMHRSAEATRANELSGP